MADDLPVPVICFYLLFTIFFICVVYYGIGTYYCDHPGGCTVQTTCLNVDRPQGLTLQEREEVLACYFGHLFTDRIWTVAFVAAFVITFMVWWLTPYRGSVHSDPIFRILRGSNVFYLNLIYQVIVFFPTWFIVFCLFSFLKTSYIDALSPYILANLT